MGRLDGVHKRAPDQVINIGFQKKPAPIKTKCVAIQNPKLYLGTPKQRP